MRLSLSDLLALVGRLSDQSGVDTPRERFRRFLMVWPSAAGALRSLVDDARRTGDEQAQRALMDLVLALGRFLGFDVTFGTYDRARGAVRFDGVWRSPGLARIVLEVRTDRTRPFSPDDLARTIAALPPVPASDASEQTFGLCVLVPLDAARRGADRSQRHPSVPDVRSPQTVDGLIALAEQFRDGQLTHEQVVARLADPEPLGIPTASVAAPATAGPHEGSGSASPYLSLVPKDQPPDHWIATIVPDEGSSPDQFVEAVIKGRRLLGVSTIGIFPATARAGDWVCFFVNGHGVMGHAQLGGEVDRLTAPLRGADRFAAVFALTNVRLYDTPKPLDPAAPAQRLATRVPFEAPGPFLSPISEGDFSSLTAPPPLREVTTLS
jgi:hypothetical protein